MVLLVRCRSSLFRSCQPGIWSWTKRQGMGHDAGIQVHVWASWPSIVCQQRRLRACIIVEEVFRWYKSRFSCQRGGDIEQE
jgi:hypothetical protein